MRTVTYGGACSLDGFIAGPDGAIDWLHFSPDVQHIMTEYWKGVDAIVMGRKTWEFAAAAGAGAAGTGDPGSGESTGDGGQPEIATYVFSRTLGSIADPRVQLVSEDAGAFVRQLKRRKGKGICVLGGGELARSLLEAGVVDEIGFNIHPVLLGSGVPCVLRGERRIQLELVESRTIAGGCVLSTYRVKRVARPTGAARAGRTTRAAG
ncbi:MAG TPA: dihydrofolate reductase family protein [Gemmatimonadaceae bacterium]|nr:dihydrofolate reductase family protein [Gemmatimonadaceae bacterium]